MWLVCSFSGLVRPSPRRLVLVILFLLGLFALRRAAFNLGCGPSPSPMKLGFGFSLKMALAEPASLSSSEVTAIAHAGGWKDLALRMGVWSPTAASTAPAKRGIPPAQKVFNFLEGQKAQSIQLSGRSKSSRLKIRPNSLSRYLGRTCLRTKLWPLCKGKST